ncbi:MAG: large subunit ribosomal protein L4 [Candidatus Tokpelaia sp. JSC085]|nr:MAG: large subunit ribosomal protein L4 [Candidatus Tokpelaia sp. JSC085]
MDLIVNTWDGGTAGKICLSHAVFGLEPRVDLLQRVVRWQLARRQQGTHQSQSRAEVSCSGRKMHKQKGTGRARHASISTPQFRGGGKAHGPVFRKHTHNLPKKVRALGLCHALSAKMKTGSLVIIDALTISEAKTKVLCTGFARLGIENALLVSGKEIDVSFRRAVANIPNVDVLSVQGINVYDILHRGMLVLSREAVQALEARFK